MHIYTRGGDAGETGLFGGARIGKDHLRVEAYGAVDELNAALGVARAAGLPGDLDPLAESLQGQLFVLGADLATPPEARAKGVRLPAEAAAGLEPVIDRLEEELRPLTTFILPGGGAGGAALHLARTVCRRAERRCVALARGATLSAGVIPFLNRLSDLLFVMARAANARAGAAEAPWTPAK